MRVERDYARQAERDAVKALADCQAEIDAAWRELPNVPGDLTLADAIAQFRQTRKALR
jgi:hypothetical protein